MKFIIFVIISIAMLSPSASWAIFNADTAEEQSISVEPDSSTAEPVSSAEIEEVKVAPAPTIKINSPYSIFDDKLLLDGYKEKFKGEPKKIILAMIKDDTLDDYRMAAAVAVFKDSFSTEVFSREKKIIIKTLLRRLNRTDSPFVQVEIMHALSRMDRYKYFNSMIPALLLKMDHYNRTVNEMAYAAINDIITTGHNRAREARIVFARLRKSLFLSRRRLAKVKEPSERLKQKLELLRWSIKVLGNQQLKRLPKEVIHLL